MKTKTHNILLICAMIIFTIITFQPSMMHTSHWDESHAWMLAKWINFDNFIDILRTEGHPLGWFLVLAPFAKLNIAHPHSMYFINWLFCFLAILIMWLKAPIKDYLKIAITFSYIFICLFSIVARNYSLGILLLFLLCAFKKNQTDFPIKYSILIILAIHVHLFFLIPTVLLAIDFLINLNKKYGVKSKNFNIPFYSILGALILFILPYMGGFGSAQSAAFAPPGLETLIKFLTTYKYCWFILYLIVAGFLFSLKEIIFPKLFLILTIIGITGVFYFFYSGMPHHFILILVYLIASTWLALSDERLLNEKKYKLNIIQILCSILMLIPLHKNFEYLHVPNAKSFIREIKSQNYPVNSVFILAETSRYLLPYLENDFNIVDCYTLEKFNYQTYNKPRQVPANLKKFYHSNDNIYIIRIKKQNYNLFKYK